MIFLAVYHRKRRKTSRGEVERRTLICYTKADESEAIMKKIKYMAVVLAAGLLLAGCEADETQNNKDAYRQIGINCMQEGDYEGPIPKGLVFRNCVFDNGDIEIAAYDRGVPGSDFTEIGPLVDVRFYHCRFNGIHFVEKNQAAGKYTDCVFDNCTHGDKCRFEIEPHT